MKIQWPISLPSRVYSNLTLNKAFWYWYTSKFPECITSYRYMYCAKFSSHKKASYCLKNINQPILPECVSHYFSLIFDDHYFLTQIHVTKFTNTCSSHMHSNFISQFPEYIFKKYYYNIYYSNSVPLYGCF